MASTNQPDGLADDFFEQILSVPSSYSAGGNDSAATGRNYGLGDGNLAGTPSAAMMLQLGSGGGGGSGFGGDGGGGFKGLGFPLGLNLPQHQQGPLNSSSSSPMNEGETVHLTSMFPTFGQLQPALPLRPLVPPQLHQPFQGRPSNGTVPSAPNHPPSMRPRPRARRGQATDPHSIAERLRRERIAERMRALQELVPTANKSDRAAMLDDIVDYVKFLRLQVKVLSMSRLGGAGAVAQLVSDVSLLSLEGDLGGGMEGGSNQQGWSEDGTEQEVAKLMLEENTGAAMQFLQSKGLCIMPVSLATTIFRARQQSDSSSSGGGVIKPEPKPANS